MKPRCSTKRNAAITLLEIGVVVAVLMILAAIYLAMCKVAVRHSSKINCVNNLKQIGLAYRIWEGDNGDIFPMGISVTNGGSMEMVQAGSVVLTFQVMSNELSTPKVLICPEDKRKSMAAWSINQFANLVSSNISYFVGVNVTNDADPLLIISGDSNLQIRGKTVKSGLFSVATNDPVAWDSSRHVHYGNLGFADGSVQSATTSMLRNSLVQTGMATNRLAIP